MSDDPLAEAAKLEIEQNEKYRQFKEGIRSLRMQIEGKGLKMPEWKEE